MLSVPGGGHDPPQRRVPGSRIGHPGRQPGAIDPPDSRERPAGHDAFRAMDPFLLMDHFGPMVLPPGTDAGFPPHPHRGFQTFTYLLQGAFRHRDSTGGAGLLRPGGAQLMNAGAGIVHEEMPVPEHLEAGGPIEGVQLWINLPRAHKGSAPWLHRPAAGGHALAGGPGRPLAGPGRGLAGVRGARRTPARIAYAHLELEPGARVPAPPAARLDRRPGAPARLGAGGAGHVPPTTWRAWPRTAPTWPWRPTAAPASCFWPGNPWASPSPTTARSS